MKAIKYIFILAVAAFIFNSCTKNVAGPAGPKGATGPQGNSSSYSVFIDSVEVSAPGTWSADPSISGYSFTMTNISALTNPNTSIVDVYYATSLNTLSAIWYTLPVSSSLQTGDVFQYYYDAYSVTVQYIFCYAPSSKALF